MRQEPPFQVTSLSSNFIQNWSQHHLVPTQGSLAALLCKSLTEALRSKRHPVSIWRRPQGVGTAHPEAVVGGRCQVPEQAGKRWHGDHDSQDLPASWRLCHLQKSGKVMMERRETEDGIGMGGSRGPRRGGILN